MKPVVKWILIALGIIILITAIAVPAGLLIFTKHLGNAGYPMMYPRFGHFPMMMPFFMRDGLFSLFAFLLLAGLFVLFIVLLVSLFSRRSLPTTSAQTSINPNIQTPNPSESPKCPHCNSPIQAGWVACPHCGEKL
jgi:hypothetical protein